MTDANTQHVYRTLDRQRRAYHILRTVAIDTGYMAHERDTAGFQRMCEALDAGTVRITLQAGGAEK